MASHRWRVNTWRTACRGVDGENVTKLEVPSCFEALEVIIFELEVSLCGSKPPGIRVRASKMN